MGNWTGFLKLEVQKKEERTTSAEVFNQGAFKITPPVYLDNSGHPCFYIMNPGGGYVDGDKYRAEITLREHAHMILTTQASTKIYKTPNAPVIQITEIEMESGSYLEYIPDPIIAYRHARYVQDTIVRMKPESTLIYGDIITPGWSPDGKPFQYDKLQLKTIVYKDDELIVYDHLQLRPEERPMQGLGCLEGYTHLGSLLVVGDCAESGLLEMIRQALEPYNSSCRIGLSALETPGFSLRVLASSTGQIERVFEHCRVIIREQKLHVKTVSLRKY